MHLLRTTAAVLLCAGLVACGARRPAPVDGQVAATTMEVTFDADATTTYGTLDIPAHRAGQRLAAALLLAGSGPTDRDGNQRPKVTPGTLQQLAAALDRMGIMSLRFDKYFTGRTGAGRYASDPGSIDLNAYIRQAGAAYTSLAAQPTADARRLLVVGHSEGGLYAILVAETVATKPAGLALVEPQDERLLDLVAVQIDETLNAEVARGAITADEARRNDTGARQAIAAFRTGQPVDLGTLRPEVATALAPIIQTPASARVARTDDAIDPPTYAARLPRGTRVLVTDGSADYNIPPATIRPLVDALARAGTTGPGLVPLQGLDHDLNPAGTPPNGAPLDPSFLGALADWAQPYRGDQGAAVPATGSPPR